MSAKSSLQTPYGYVAFARAFRRESDISRTKTGLLLLIIGALLSPILFLNILGEIIILVGALLIILGRKPFGDIHSRNTILSVIVYIVGAAVVSLGAAWFVLAGSSAGSLIITSGPYSPLPSQSLSDALQTYLIATAVGGAIIGLSQVLFTYALQIGSGKTSLWLGYFSSIAIGVLEVAIGLSLISGAMSQTCCGQIYSPTAFANLQSQLLLIGLLGFIPALFYANAFYLARERIVKKEIPELRPSHYSRIGSLFDDYRYLLAIFAKFMMPIVVLAALWLILVTFYHF